MTTIEERREIAAKIRKYAECDECESCEECEDACTIDRDDFGNTVLTVLHVCGESDRTCYDRLADLIEPCENVKCVAEIKIDGEQLEEAAQKAAAEYAGIDRERLLAIATVMAADSVRSAKQGSSVSPVYILHAARNIAEACGETFGSIRNQELAKCGTSIVPKETIVDRDALLAIADEMNDACPESASVAIGYLDDYACRIREAVGVE